MPVWSGPLIRLRFLLTATSTPEQRMPTTASDGLIGLASYPPRVRARGVREERLDTPSSSGTAGDRPDTPGLDARHPSLLLGRVRLVFVMKNGRPSAPCRRRPRDGDRYLAR